VALESPPPITSLTKETGIAAPSILGVPTPGDRVFVHGFIEVLYLRQGVSRRSDGRPAGILGA
jgi:hypothetical protein